MSAAVEQLWPAIRPMHHTDVAAVAEVERQTYEYPWSAGIFRDCLLAGYISVVLDSGGEVVGYGIMSVAAGEAHLLNLCIAGEFRRRGVGSRLLHYLLSRAQHSGTDRVFLEVRPSNKPALKLYRQAGFQAVGLRKGYYRAADGSEDAVVLVYRFRPAS